MPVISDEAIAAAPYYDETGVRFHVIDPIIRMLGYPDTENTYLSLEKKLEYPYLHIGRRLKKGVPLGYPDYRAGVKGARGSFTVVARAGSVPITKREVEQARAYAAHARVGANYCMLGNGGELLVYETLSGPDAAPTLRLPLGSLNARFSELENILSPKNLARNCHVEYCRSLGLADGIGPSLRIRSGRCFLSEYDLRIMLDGRDCTSLVRQSFPHFTQAELQLELSKPSFEMQVSDGFAERRDNGKIVVHVEFSKIAIHKQDTMAIMGIDKATFVTADESLSLNPESPTIFESLTDFTLSHGVSLSQLFGGAMVMEGDAIGSMFFNAAMHYRDGNIYGEYIAFSDQDVSIPGQIPLRLEVDMAGTFELEVDA